MESIGKWRGNMRSYDEQELEQEQEHDDLNFKQFYWRVYLLSSKNENFCF